MNNTGSNNDPSSGSGRQRTADRVRAARAIELRTRGHTLDDIADQLGYSDRAAAHRAIIRSLARTEAENAAEYRTLMSDRYESLYRRCIDALDEAEDGREVGRAQLISAARNVCDSLVRLHGLDNSAVLTVRTETQLDRDIARLTEAVAAIDVDPEPTQHQLPAPNTEGPAQ